MKARIGFLGPVILVCAALFLFAAPATYAQPADCPPGSVCLTNPINVSTVPELVANILQAVLGVVGAFALLVFIYGGFLWLTSGGESAKVSAGKEAMKWAAVGLVVIFTSYGLVRFVFSAITG